MKRKITAATSLVLLLFIITITTSSCSKNIGSEMPLQATNSPVSQPSDAITARPTKIILDNPYTLKLLPFINFDRTGIMDLDLRLSPNGELILIWPDYLQIDKDSISVINIINNKKFSIQITSTFLDISLDQRFKDKIPFYYGSLSSDLTTWSPDNHSFMLLGPAFWGQPYRFLMIFDISDPENVKQSIVKWNYEGVPYVSWSPDGENILIWFGHEIELGKNIDVHYSEKAWIVNRDGKLLKVIDTVGLHSPRWVNDSLFVIKDDNEILKVNIHNNSEAMIYKSGIPIYQIMDVNEEKSKLLLLENAPPFDLLLLDIMDKKIIDKIPLYSSSLTNGLPCCIYSLSTLSHYTIIRAVDLFIFDWSNNSLSVYDYDEFKFTDPFWSQKLGGIIVQNVEKHELDIIYPK